MQCVITYSLLVILSLLVCVSLQKAYKRRGESSDAVSEVYYKNMVLIMLCVHLLCWYSQVAAHSLGVCLVTVEAI